MLKNFYVADFCFTLYNPNVSLKSWDMRKENLYYPFSGELKPVERHTKRE